MAVLRGEEKQMMHHGRRRLQAQIELNRRKDHVSWIAGRERKTDDRLQEKKETGDRFSFHDAHIIAMDVDYDSGELRLVPQYGFVDTAADEMVDGEVIVTGVSPEDSYVYIMEYKNVLTGNVGSFVGEK